ncbi:MAG: rhodanese-like domain-containing protein [Polyangiaceae bacterium]|nr:rhodanese-like domain-containing protein [Polyangiaceae bacterium]
MMIQSIRVTAPHAAAHGRLTPTELAEALVGPRPPTVIDVRTLDEFFDDPLGRVPGALVVPLPHLAAEAETLRALGTDLVVYCRTDERAFRAAASLRAAGLAEVSVLAGGIVAWRRAGLPVEHEVAA